MRQLSDIILNQHPLTLPPTATAREACRQMRERQVGSVLVTDNDGTLLGIFTGRDAVARIVAQGLDADTTQLEAVMTPSPATLNGDKTAIDALRMMWQGGYRHLPVVLSGRVAGVVSRGDFNGLEAERLDEERSLWEHIR